MDLPVYACFFQELAKQAAAIPREFGGGMSRSGRRPMRASTLLSKSKPKAGFPPSKEDDPSAEGDATRTEVQSLSRVDYAPSSAIVSG